MGRELERVEVVSEPILADRPLTLPDGAVVVAGRTAGADQRATGWFDGRPWLEVSMTLHVDPASAGLSPTDRIELEGRHGLTVTVDPGCRALLSTAAMIVNGLPRAIAAPAGVHRPGDLPPVAPWLGDEPAAVGARCATGHDGRRLARNDRVVALAVDPVALDEGLVEDPAETGPVRAGGTGRRRAPAGSRSSARRSDRAPARTPPRTCRAAATRAGARPPGPPRGGRAGRRRPRRRAATRRHSVGPPPQDAS